MNQKKLSLFVMPNFPDKGGLSQQLKEIEKEGVDFVEIGIPFSDPMADGPIIQEAATISLKNGTTIQGILDEIKAFRELSALPIYLMGYFNPILKFGLDEFLLQCSCIGIDGVIIPDISFEIYQYKYGFTFEKYGIPLIFMITPDTSVERQKQIEKFAQEFIYYVGKPGTTGGNNSYKNELDLCSNRLKIDMMVGFGIHDKQSFLNATNNFTGGIIGSAFLSHLKAGKSIGDFVSSIRD